MYLHTLWLSASAKSGKLVAGWWKITESKRHICMCVCVHWFVLTSANSIQWAATPVSSLITPNFIWTRWDIDIFIFLKAESLFVFEDGWPARESSIERSYQALRCPRWHAVFQERRYWFGGEGGLRMFASAHISALRLKAWLVLFGVHIVSIHARACTHTRVVLQWNWCWWAAIHHAAWYFDFALSLWYRRRNLFIVAVVSVTMHSCVSRGSSPNANAVFGGQVLQCLPSVAGNGVWPSVLASASFPVLSRTSAKLSGVTSLSDEYTSWLWKTKWRGGRAMNTICAFAVFREPRKRKRRSEKMHFTWQGALIQVATDG